MTAVSPAFGHREHVQLAWSELRDHEPREALVRVEATIRHVAAAHGEPAKFHRTITAAWMALVEYHRSEAPELEFDAFLDRFPALLDRHLLDRHFSSELIASGAARERPLAPDLRPLPAR
jgi:hypothetical protein